jgi:hypothetical protein
MRFFRFLSEQVCLGILSAVLSLCALPHALAADAGWTSLFNGKDLQGWTTWVSMQPPANGVKTAATVRGSNNDPLRVFSVADGALRVSGQEWGAVTSQGEYDRFHLKFEFKWGTAKWPPRLNSPRDSGVLYYAVGPEGAQGGHWMRSHEFQLQEGDCGDYHSLDGVTVDAHVGDANEGNWKFFRYDPSLPLRTGIAARILKRGNYERPSGEWNTMEIIADGKTLIHIVNGHEVLRAENSRQTVDGAPVPLAKGKLQIQSEGAEAFFRNILIKPLTVAAAEEKY